MSLSIIKSIVVSSLLISSISVWAWDPPKAKAHAGDFKLGLGTQYFESKDLPFSGTIGASTEQFFIFDSKRNITKSKSDLFLVYANAFGSKGIGTGSTTFTNSHAELLTGYQLGKLFNLPSKQTGGYFVGASVSLDHQAGVKSKTTVFNQTIVDAQAELGLSTLNQKDNLIQLMAPVGIRIESTTDQHFQARNLTGLEYGLDFRLYQRTGENRSIQAQFSQIQANVANQTGQSQFSATSTAGVTITWKVKKSQYSLFLNPKVYYGYEKNYDNTVVKGEPVGTRQNLGVALSGGVQF